MTERKPLVLDPASGQPMELPEGDTVAGGGTSSGGGTWSQPSGTPVTLADDEETTITHPSVSNERLVVAVWRDAAQTGQTWSELDFDLADEGDFAQQDADDTEFVAGVVRLHASYSGDPEIATPQMTDYTAPSGIASASADPYPQWYAAWKAFNRSNAVETDAWTCIEDVQYGTPASWEWLKYDFGSPVYIDSYSFRARNNSPTYAPETWILQGSNDNSSWTDLESENTKASWSAQELWSSGTLSNPGSYRYARVQVRKGTNSGGVSISDLRLMTRGLSFPVSTWRWVSTTDANRFERTQAARLVSASHTATTPAGTSLRALVSFDGRTTWKKWDGDSWETHSGGLSSISTGNTLAEIEAGLEDYEWQEGDTGIDLAWGLYSEDAEATPSLSAFALTYDEATRYDPASIGGYGSAAEFGVRRISPTQTKIKNLTGSTQKIHASVLT